MEGESSRGHDAGDVFFDLGSSQRSAGSDYNPDHLKTLYIPKHDGGKTLMRRRRTSSKRRSSSRRRREEHVDLDDLLNEEDNHLLPSLRIQRRHKTKSLKGR